MDNRREFLRKAIMLSGATGLVNVMPIAIQKAMAIDPAPGSTYLDAEHIVILMQENRSFDHAFGSLSGVRGFNDPRAITLPNKNPVWFQTDDAGHTYAPFRLNIKESKSTWTGDLPHSRASQVDAYNSGKYDNWLLSKKSNNQKYAAMPLTLGHYTREDLPFNYAMADAFTICDQNFCSAMTSTTPNRSYFWSGQIMSTIDDLPKANIRNDDYSYGKHKWKTFPELLENNGISWSFYQNEVSSVGGFQGEERSWLGNFGCNLLEFFAAYNVKFQDGNIESLQKRVDTLPGEINKLQEESPSSDERALKVQASIRDKQKALDIARDELSKWNKNNFEKLSPSQKSLFHRAFVTNTKDGDYRSLDKLTYEDDGVQRELAIPKGDLLHQFRTDVNTGKLPTVSWLAGPQNFSDHPSAPWYGAWYVSEILDILTKNPEIWKKTIFIVTYDENDGYYDHIPPYSIPDLNKPETGKVSAGIETELEFVRLVNELKQGIPEKQAREAPIGLGFRVPMLIASPWSRGGKVCSQVFDHTSTLQFLEDFVNKKYKKSIHFENISEWRRTICGDLTSAFTPFNPKKDQVSFIDRNQFIETIHNAKFKSDPGNFKAISEQQISDAQNTGSYKSLMSQQEVGKRPSTALPYQLRAEGQILDKNKFRISMKVDNEIFGKNTSGSPFTVYVPGSYTDTNAKEETCRNWAFAVKAGDQIQYEWPIKAFENGQYELHLHGPNGFFREFKGSAQDPNIQINAVPELKRVTKIPTGNITLTVTNIGSHPITISVDDLSYKKGSLAKKTISPNASQQMVIDLQNSFGWYDFAITSPNDKVYLQRFAGHIETGKESFTDPLINRS
ncbi:phospholipase C [Sphingobacterium sp. ML3W]|uniref:phosphocholine-specific phospholipase C n=1 Tax=Sphingobacterium sp. ML3W TaxID=1538644 RepID=UPI0004F62051|nr:phospholipase C, phosphocholine-specific [Sphingobacterium sp. ML3W]AIM37615.1 phospholipase C [Sphingobacterium sp. ML3W]